MAERLRLRGTIWYGTLYIDGTRKECSTTCTDKEAARAVLANWEREAADPDRAAANATLNDALNRVLADREARARNGDGALTTVAFYRRLGGHLVRVLGHDFPLTRFKSAAVASEYIHARRQEGAKDTTIDKEIMLLRAALRLAKEFGLWNGALDAVIPKSFDPGYQPKERELTRDEVLALIPQLSPDSAAAVAFILATSAEDAALRTARREDLPADGDPQARVHVRGTKAARRDRFVPIITDEQWMLLDFARRHAQGKDGRLFGPLTNFRRDLMQAADKANIPHVWPHALRKAAGQFLIDLHVPLELVSRVLGHVDTRVTELVYARVREEDLGDRMLTAIDPEYARRTLDARGTPKRVATITALPDPKAGPVLYTVIGISRTLDQWAKVHAIPKGTLYSRVVERGMSMADALKLGSRSRDAAAHVQSSQPLDPAAADRRTGAADTSDTGGLIGQLSVATTDPPNKKPRKNQGSEVPRDRIELPTRGFSILCSTN